jgi:selenocysteine lyase/cysteine desulfurase
VACLTGWLLDALGALMHDNGEPLVRFYGPATRRGRGGTIAFNFCTRDGRLLDHRVVERRAAHERISLRTGSFCNPGAGETALGLSKEMLEDCFRRSGDWMRADDFNRCIDSRGSGAVRVSFGLVSNFADAQAMVELATRFLGWGDDAQD